ncbi:uncharacterized protein N0V89_000554 [Didymosphaeria variabile]|uniref:Uncharacterized protein n=1 Tax=Didymosphaeria variabile TaxID=1932322 RepID=A0A9W8XWD6_9PLEO|nr:uncharacterized protein N0V89_000554 [Didymosphaeria variabile]KAJ4359995.1 hypothetical protein N0V89_000554 [Didymosphaeria variabile]
MSFQRNTHGRLAGNEVETVDLTFSSPSPEPPPKPQQHQRHTGQQRLPTYLNKEQGATPIRTNGASSSTSRSQTATNNPQPLPSVSAAHLRQIINSSPPQKVADLLLELCKSSPALSGAVARGLAPHSIWAQNTIRDYQRRARLPRVKSELGNPSSSSAAVPRKSPVKRSYGSPRTPHPKAPVKYGIDSLEPDTDDSLSDLEVLLEQPSGSSKAKAVGGPSSSTYGATADQNPTQPALSVRIKPEPKASSVCMQCNKQIQPETTCYFHVGRTKTSTQGTQKTQVWTCCNEPLNSIGCCSGDHIPLRETKLDPASASTGPKKPRLI